MLVLASAISLNAAAVFPEFSPIPKEVKVKTSREYFLPYKILAPWYAKWPTFHQVTMYGEPEPVTMRLSCFVNKFQKDDENRLTQVSMAQLISILYR